MKKFKKVVSLFLATVMLASCGGGSESSKSSDINSDTPHPSGYNEFISVDVFNSLANYQGIQSGWFAKVVKDKFNMELNIISPNVAGGGDTLYQTRVSAGDLGDLIITGSDNGRLNDLSKYGLLYNMAEGIDERENLKKYMGGIESVNSANEVEGYYGVPIDVSQKEAYEPSELMEPSFAPYIRWDLYKELGYPQMSTFNDLLDILEDMQELEPTTETGKKVYALSMFSDWDGNMMMYAKQPITMYGYDEVGYVMASADGSDFQGILDENGYYLNSLQFFFDANQRGLVDPESTTQNFDMVYSKYQEGAVLFSPWAWLGQQAYNTIERKEAGKGFLAAPIDDLKIFSFGARPNGDKNIYAIGSKAEDPERLMDFIDWLYSPEGTYMVSGGAAGPEGLTWELVDGEPKLTSFGIEAFYGIDAVVPDEWGGGIYTDGVPALYNSVLFSDIDPNTGYSYSYESWPSVIEMNSTPVDIDWQEYMEASSTMEYYENNDQITVANGASYISPAENSEISTIRGQVNAIIKEYSWRMSFANNQTEFDELFKELRNTAYGLGYEKVLDFDMQNAKEQAEARALVGK